MFQLPIWWNHCYSHEWLHFITGNQTKPDILGPAAKIFLVGSSRLKRGATLSMPWFLDSWERWLWKNSAILIAYLDSIKLPQDISPFVQDTTNWWHNWVFKGHSIVLSRQQLQDDGKQGKISEFHENEPILYFTCCSSSFLIRINAGWNVMTVNKAFCNSMDSDFGRNPMGREGKFISRVPGPLRTKYCPSMIWVLQCSPPNIR